MNETTAWKKLEEYFSKKSMMEILGVDRDESAHSKFLAWLFENKDTREVSILQLILLLKKEHKGNIPFFNKFNEQSFSIIDTKVILEDIVEYNGAYGRADIVIEVIYNENKHLYIIIENKIDSFEHKMGKGKNWQTDAYSQFYKNKYGDENCLFAFLTRPNITETDIPIKLRNQYRENCRDGRPQNDSFIWINYQNVLDKILKVVVERFNGYPKLKETKFHVNDYIHCLGINKTQNDLMAISSDSEIVKQSVAIWNSIKDGQWDSLKDHQDLIRPLFVVLYHKKDCNDFKKIENIYKIVTGKDYTTYIVGERESNLTKNKLVKTVVELYLEKHGFENIKEDFPPSLRMFCKGSSAKDTSLSNQVVINFDEYKKVKKHRLLSEEPDSTSIEQDSKWKEIEFKGKPSGWYVIQTGWDGKPMMANFIKHAVRLLEGVSIKEHVDDNKLNKIKSILTNKRSHS